MQDEGKWDKKGKEFLPEEFRSLCQMYMLTVSLRTSYSLP